jgi:hypothetical protein
MKSAMMLSICAVLISVVKVHAGPEPDPVIATGSVDVWN